MLRAILFDFNGVLVDDEPLHLEMFQRVLAEEGVQLSAAEYYDRYLGLDDRACFAAVLAAAGERPEPQRLVRLVARKATYYRTAVTERGLPFFPGAEQLVREAFEGGIMLGVVSGALRDEVEDALRQAGLRDCFKVVVTAEDVAGGKPDPESYRRGMELLNAQPPLPARLFHPHEVLAIEDSPAGIRAAATAGLVTLGVLHTLAPERLEEADVVAEGLEALSLERLQELYAVASRA